MRSADRQWNWIGKWDRINKSISGGVTCSRNETGFEKRLENSIYCRRIWMWCGCKVSVDWYFCFYFGWNNVFLEFEMWKEVSQDVSVKHTALQSNHQARTTKTESESRCQRSQALHSPKLSTNTKTSDQRQLGERHKTRLSRRKRETSGSVKRAARRTAA